MTFQTILLPFIRIKCVLEYFICNCRHTYNFDRHASYLCVFLLVDVSPTLKISNTETVHKAVFNELHGRLCIERNSVGSKRSKNVDI